MEVIALIMAAFAALLAVERRKKGAWHRDDPNTDDLDENEPDIIAGVGYTAPVSPAAAYRKAQKAAKSPVVERGRFKIKGKHGEWWIREKDAKSRGGYGPGNVSQKHGHVHTLRQAKEWMWCLHNGWNYDECKKAHKREKQREYNRDRPRRRRTSWNAFFNRERREINRYKKRYANTWDEDNELQLWRMERYGSDVHDVRCVCNQCMGWGWRADY
tara:strand:- start:917 stop:1561 length:645 start_codon:yes stop_codon:yes gene_type:complete